MIKNFDGYRKKPSNFSDVIDKLPDRHKQYFVLFDRLWGKSFFKFDHLDVFIFLFTSQILVWIFLFNVRVKHCVIHVDQIIWLDSLVFLSNHMTFSFFQMQKQETKSNNELKLFRMHCGWESIFHPLSTDNQLSELGTSIQIKRSNTQKDLHLLAPTIVFEWFYFSFSLYFTGSPKHLFFIIIYEQSNIQSRLWQTKLILWIYSSESEYKRLL
jgi:hypothetical protein